jgi:hypothetical protein
MVSLLPIPIYIYGSTGINGNTWIDGGILRDDDYLTFHSQLVMKGTDVRETPRMCEGHPEPRDTQRGLNKPDPLLWGSDNEPGVHVVGA